MSAPQSALRARSNRVNIDAVKIGVFREQCHGDDALYCKPVAGYADGLNFLKFAIAPA